MSTTRLEHQQEILVNALRRARGALVSYGELRDAGIEFPAAVVAELVLAGVPIERCSQPGPDGKRIIGVRLIEPVGPPWGAAPATEATIATPASGPTAAAPATDSTGAPPPARPVWHEVRFYRTSFARGLGLAALTSVSLLPHMTRRGARKGSASPRRSRLRLSAPLVLLVTIGVVLTVLLITLARGTQHHRAPVVQTHRAGVAASRPPSRVRRAAASTVAASARAPGAAPSPTPVSPALATELEKRGHSLLEKRFYADAVPVLRNAVHATGESLDACVEPASSTCLIYAYALYDLGRALRLSGHPAAAVPVLERRLQIDDQRPTVEAELQLARRDIG